MTEPAGKLVSGLHWAKFHQQLFLFLAYATSQSNRVYKCPYSLHAWAPGRREQLKKDCARPCHGLLNALDQQMLGFYSEFLGSLFPSPSFLSSSSRGGS